MWLCVTVTETMFVSCWHSVFSLYDIFQTILDGEYIINNTVCWVGSEKGFFTGRLGVVMFKGGMVKPSRIIFGNKMCTPFGVVFEDIWVDLRESHSSVRLSEISGPPKVLLGVSLGGGDPPRIVSEC